MTRTLPTVAAIALLRIVEIRIAADDFAEAVAREQGNAVVTFLTVEVHVVAQRFDIGEGELLVADFGFLEANHVRLVFFDQRCQLMRPSAQAIDVE